MGTYMLIKYLHLDFYYWSNLTHKSESEAVVMAQTTPNFWKAICRSSGHTGLPECTLAFCTTLSR